MISALGKSTAKLQPCLPTVQHTEDCHFYAYKHLIRLAEIWKITKYRSSREKVSHPWFHCYKILRKIKSNNSQKTSTNNEKCWLMKRDDRIGL
jgi:hypothetical protein